MATIDDLPIEILSLIFEYVGARYRNSCSLVCQKWLFARRCPAFYRSMRCSQNTLLDADSLEDFLDSYHPYSKLTFYGVENFTSHFPELENGEESVWQELEKVTELKFVDCRGFFDKTLRLILHHLSNVQKLTVIERNKFPWLVMQFPTITTLDLSQVAIALPKVLVNTLDCFPALQTLIIADTFLWRHLEEEISELCSLVPRVRLSFENFFVHLNDSILECFCEIENLEVTSIKFDLETSLRATERFLIRKGRHLENVEVQGTLDATYLRLIDLFCLDLRLLTINFHHEPQYNPFNLLKNLRVEEIKISTGELLNLGDIDPTVKFSSVRKMTLKGLIFYDEFFLTSFPGLSELTILNFTSGLKLGSGIHSLRLKGGSIADPVLEAMGFFSLINMEDIVLEGPITDASLKRFVWPTLSKLTLIKSEIGLNGVKDLCKNCPHIESLALRNCFGLEDGCAKVIARDLRSLREIDLTGTSITEYGAKFFSNTVLREQVLKTARSNIETRRKSLIKELKCTIRERQAV